MRELVVVSGKGGTGKTSVTGALASLAGERLLVDCDVDAADLHLIQSHTVVRRKDFIGSKRASIVRDRCTDCGVCADYCRFDAIRFGQAGHRGGADATEHWYVDRHACDGCGVCVRHCSEDAIDFKDVVSGEWYVSETPGGPMIHARLGIAEANSGKLVSLLRREARAIAEQRGIETILVDGPPGIGCPLIASVTGANFVLAVTEPSMSALHDLERVLELTGHFGIATGICINKADINSEMADRIASFAQRRQVPVLSRIPYDRVVTEAQLSGVSVVEFVPDSITSIVKELWISVQERLADSGSASTGRILKRIT